VLGAAALTAWGLKRHYADASPDDLLWILSPTTQLVGLTTGATFAFQPGEGYLSREHLFLIEKSCAGINFMIAAFGMLVWALLHRVRSAGTSAQIFGMSLLASYSAAVVVNAVRIAMAMWLAAHPSAWSAFSAADVHRFEGVAVYFGGLVLLYEAVQWFDRTVHAFQRAAVPLASYYVVTLGIPLANGAAASGAFARHALFVLIVPPILIVLGCAAQKAFLLNTELLATQRRRDHRGDADRPHAERTPTVAVDRPARRDRATSNRSRFMTLSQAATKSRTNFSFASSDP
jgi:exosortase K